MRAEHFLYFNISRIYGGDLVVLLLLTCLLLLPLWESVIVLFFVVRYFMSIAIILMGKRELVTLLSLSSWCLVVVMWLFLAVPWVSLQFVIMVFPDHTLLLLYWTEGRLSEAFLLRTKILCFYIQL